MGLYPELRCLSKLLVSVGEWQLHWSVHLGKFLGGIASIRFPSTSSYRLHLKNADSSFRGCWSQNRSTTRRRRSIRINVWTRLSPEVGRVEVRGLRRCHCRRHRTCNQFYDISLWLVPRTCFWKPCFFMLVSGFEPTTDGEGKEGLHITPPLRQPLTSVTSALSLII